MPSPQSDAARTHRPMELQLGEHILRFHSRVVETFHTGTDSSTRWHVSTVAFAAKDPDRDGRVKVRVGMLRGSELNLGAGGVAFKVEPADWSRLQAFVDAVKREQRAAPEPW